MPPVIFVQGELRTDDHGVSVVGSRHASPSGLKFAADVARLLVEAGLTVISGLAEGVDSAAHRAAIEESGRTVAVVGCGLNHVYPPSNRALQAQIARHGMVLSQFMPDFAPTKWSFPLRNATMSAYGYATVIADAGERSGTRIQAREAIAHGRPVIIRDTVAAGTRWGQDLIGQPGVHVASTPAEAVADVMKVRGIDDEVTRLLELA